MSKVWFVTGAGSGIGAATAEAALNAGDRVVATGRNVDKVRNAIGSGAGNNLEILPLDVSNEAQARAAADRAVKRFGRIDVVVNNAGYSLLGNFEELTNDDFERQLATNFRGVLNVMRAALPVMREQRSGHIVNISSVAGAVGLKHCSAYAASKFAVEGLTLSVAEEVGRFGIHMTLVEPGFFRTELLAEANAQWARLRIADYAAAEPTAKEMWSPYAGTQPNDPRKLGEILVKLACMATPPRIFVAGPDAIEVVGRAVEDRLKAVRAFEALSRSTHIAS
jgi:NAD(P)-dependent dehydrogenase (short-subunit alcohol dehydrogenase family)